MFTKTSWLTFRIFLDFKMVVGYNYFIKKLWWVMKDIFTIELSDDLFEKVVNEKKTVHLEINDNKHKVMVVGNQLTFVNKTEDGVREVSAVIENLLYFSTITEAIETVGKEPCGFRPSATYEKASDVFLTGESFETVEKYGIVAIIFKIVK